jgi:hypothetical protein
MLPIFLMLRFWRRIYFKKGVREKGLRNFVGVIMYLFEGILVTLQEF